MVIEILLFIVVPALAATLAWVLAQRAAKRRIDNARLVAMGTATARILHQVKNPLSTILLHAELLDDDRLNSDVQTRRELSRAIKGEALRMNDMLAELSAYAAGSSRRLDLVPVALHELVLEMVRLTARDEAVAGTGTQIVPGVVQEVVVSGDPFYLRQVVENLIRNALEALAGSTSGRKGRIELSLRRKGGQALLEVRDDGPGIPPDRLRRVLEPFATSKPRGLGLGLPICREIVRSLDGRLEVRSRPGEGTTISIILPAVPARSAVSQPA